MLTLVSTLLKVLIARKQKRAQPTSATFAGIGCPKCGSDQYHMTLSDWVIGYKVENDGMTAFTKRCKRCGHQWTERSSDRMY